MRIHVQAAPDFWELLSSLPKTITVYNETIMLTLTVDGGYWVAYYSNKKGVAIDPFFVKKLSPQAALLELKSTIDLAAKIAW